MTLFTEFGETIPQLAIVKNVYSGDYYPSSYFNKKNEIIWIVRLKSDELKKAYADTSQNVTSRQLIGKDAIPFSVKDIRGSEYSLINIKGKVIVMNFWFIGCHPCVKEIPELNKLVKKYKGKDVVFLGFALDKKEKLESFLKKTPFNYTIIPESEAINKSYGVKVSPTHIVIDKDLKIKYYAVESVKSNEKSNLEKEIDKLLID